MIIWYFRAPMRMRVHIDYRKLSSRLISYPSPNSPSLPLSRRERERYIYIGRSREGIYRNKVGAADFTEPKLRYQHRRKDISKNLVVRVGYEYAGSAIRSLLRSGILHRQIVLVRAETGKVYLWRGSGRSVDSLEDQQSWWKKYYLRHIWILS